MKYIVMGFILAILIVFVFIYPFRISIYNNENYLYINISKFINLKVNLFVLLNNTKINKNSTTGFKVLKKIKFKEVDLKLQGLNFDYNLNGGYFGLLYAIFGFIDSICNFNNIEFNYELNYNGDKSVDFKSIARARVINVLKVFNGI